MKGKSCCRILNENGQHLTVESYQCFGSQDCKKEQWTWTVIWTKYDQIWTKYAHVFSFLSGWDLVVRVCFSFSNCAGCLAWSKKHQTTPTQQVLYETSATTSWEGTQKGTQMEQKANKMVFICFRAKIIKDSWLTLPWALWLHLEPAATLPVSDSFSVSCRVFAKLWNMLKLTAHLLNSS